MTPAPDVRATIDAVWRIESPRLIAGLTRVVRDVGVAEDLAQDALVAALEQWPASGVPENPGAWLMAAAKYRAIDHVRRDRTLERGDIVGRAGIERAFDETLRGRRGYKFVTVNNLGRQFGEAELGREPDHGEPLTTTLDLRLQRKLHEAFGEEAGAGVFLDPWTGEVLAGDSDKPLVGGSVKIIRVGETQTIARVRLTTDQLNANPRVRLSPPADLVK